MFLNRLSSAFSRSRRTALAPATLQPAAPGDLRELARRTVPRDGIDFHTMISVEGLGVLDARLMDISPYGCQARARSRILERGERIWVLLPLIGEHQADVMWGLKGLFGCRFVEPIAAEAYTELLPQLHGTHPGLTEER